MLVDIKKLKPNPYRDFDLYPYDEEQVEKLMDSYKANLDFGVLPARPNGSGDTYEIAAGHHRLEAMRRLRWKEIDIKIEDYDDDQMVQIMVDENSKQMGQNAAAVLDSVCAAIQRIAYVTLTADWATLGEFSQGLYNSERGFETARGQIESGEGVGRSLIESYLLGRLSERTIRSTLLTIKSGDLHAKIIARVKGRVEAETAEARRKAEAAAAAAKRAAEQAERERRAAEEKAAAEAAEHRKRIEKIERERDAARKAAVDAKAQRDREVAQAKQRELAARAAEERRRADAQAKANEELRRKREMEAARLAKDMERNKKAAEQVGASTRRAQGAATQTKARADAIAVKFDERCARLFKHDSHLDYFRERVTGGAIGESLPFENQLPLAKAIIEYGSSTKQELTRTLIAEFLGFQLKQFLRSTQKVLKEQAIRESSGARFIEEFQNLRKALGRAAGLAEDIEAQIDKHPNPRELPIEVYPIPAVINSIPNVVASLERLQKRITKLIDKR